MSKFISIILMINGKSTISQGHSPARWQNRTRAAWYVAAILSLVITIAAIPGYIRAVPEGFGVFPFATNPSTFVLITNAISVLFSVANVLISIFLAFLLFRRRPKDRMAIFLSFYLLAFGILTGPLEFLGLIVANSSTNFVWNVNLVLFQTAMFTATCFLFALFPDGRFAPSWSRYVAMASLVVSPLSVIGFLVWSRSDSHPLAALVTGSILPGMIMVGVLYTLFYRYRYLASGQQRQQIKWVVYGLGIMLFILFATALPYFWSFTLPEGTLYPIWLGLIQALYFISFTALPVSLTIAVMRSRLYDIDILINRTLVYGVLTASTMGIYVLSVGYLGNLIQDQNRSIIAFLTTGLVALLFQPLRQRLQAAVNRLMYGERSDPVSVLSKLGKQLAETPSPREALGGMVSTIAQTLKLPYVAIEFGGGDKAQVIASFGQSPESIVQFPIEYQGHNIGCLLVAPRSPGESFGDNDRILLENIARQAGAAAQAAKLTSDLQRSRQGLVTAREEERRRLRRDLHDGIGPTMAGQTLKLDAAIDLILGSPESGQASDLEEAVKMLTEVKEQTQATVKNIRQIVYELRPPSLDDLGLVAAIQAYLGQLSVSRYGLDIRLETTPQELPRLSAAVEVAAYRIVLEALTNVINHAQAQDCVVELSVPEDEFETLYLEIKDNGKGFSEEKPVGVGLTSIRERVEELGGSFTIESGPGKGTHILAQIPLFSMET